MARQRLTYDPTEFSSPEEAARNQVGADSEFGMPREPYENNEMGRHANELHFRRQAAMNDEFGWHGTTREQLRQKWGLD